MRFGEISNFQIEAFCKKNKIKLDDVIMKDQFPNKKIKNIIVNLESSFQGRGTHWTCLLQRNNNYFYFDPFGITPPQEVYSYMVDQPQHKSIGHNSYDIQNMSSENCGFYCLGILHYVQHSKESFYDACNSYINMFSNNTNENDYIIEKYIRENCV